MLKDLPKRLFTSSISLGVVFAILLFAHSGWAEYLVLLGITALAGIGAWEYAQFAKIKGAKISISFFVACGTLQVLSFYVSAKVAPYAALPIFFYFLATFLFFAIHFGKKEGALTSVSLSSFGLSYVCLPMGMLLAILYMKQGGTWWIAYLLFVTKASDIGAYFGGSLLGKRKLASHISPSKTIEGAWAGLFLALLVSFGFYLIQDFHLTGLESVLLGLLFAVVGQFSDLAESLLKRDVNIKDSNRLPGLGGVLDTVDSLLFNAPILYLYLNFLRPHL